MRVAFVRSSKNRKTGPIPISMSPKVYLSPELSASRKRLLRRVWAARLAVGSALVWRDGNQLAGLSRSRPALTRTRALEAQRQRGSSRQRRQDQHERCSPSLSRQTRQAWLHVQPQARDPGQLGGDPSCQPQRLHDQPVGQHARGGRHTRPKEGGPGGRDPAGRCRVPPRRAHPRGPEGHHLPRELSGRHPVRELRPLRRSYAHRNHRVSGPRAGIQESRARGARNEVSERAVDSRTVRRRAAHILNDLPRDNPAGDFLIGDKMHYAPIYRLSLVSDGRLPYENCTPAVE